MTKAAAIQARADIPLIRLRIIPAVSDDPRYARRLRAEEFEFEGLVIKPLSVSTFGAIGENADPLPLAMTVEIDPDSVPGLRATLEQHCAGSELDTQAQWYIVIPDDVTHSPAALLQLRFPETQTEFSVLFVVDDFKRSLLTAARTGRLMIVEPALAAAMRVQAPEQALRTHLSIGVSLGDAEPLRRALMQRFDMPLDAVMVEPVVVPAAEAGPALSRFNLGSSTPTEIALISDVDVGAVIVVRDDEAAGLQAEIDSRDGTPWAGWASAQAGPYVFARLDLLVGTPGEPKSLDERVRAWTIANPPQELIRATSSGPHLVAVVTVPLNEGLSGSDLASAAHFVAPEGSQAMRALLH